MNKQSVVLALIIGVKDYLDNELKAAYSSAGAMHVLAVSGLHVGIVYQLILILFSFVKKVRYGRIVFIVVALGGIWLYALVTGFTSSVLRASIMFSVILLSEHTGFKPSIYNSLGIAAFVLLLINPNYIYSVGFQLSFIAVFGIVFLHPILYRQLYFNTKLADYLWSITCVSLSAQAATFPLTIYYFHQFPTYFLVSNIVVIPAAMIMLVLGLMMLLFAAFIPIVSTYIGIALVWLVWGVNEYIGLLQRLPKPIVDWLYFDAVDTWLVYGILLSIALGFSQLSFQKIGIGLILVICLNAKVLLDKYDSIHREKLVFYEIQDHVAFDIISGKKSMLFIDQWNYENAERIGFQINPNRLANNLGSIEKNFSLIHESKLLENSDIGQLMIWYNKRILIYNPTESIYLKDSVFVDLLYLERFEPVLAKIQAKTILLGSNLKSWQKVKIKRQFPVSQVHSLYEDGFFEYEEL